ncbi:endo alpha-1,4 polygalactosaminidase [Yinghuangia soli]|uniref:Endo alpha-1,4 polygalactosaminidase n=1 Tax=Yinghuangia soli TaxID=2908204 RepID=A0AA41Q033_9ACTN|nr:endo alpha-1,4 polygalactosaminidase [Yinghuangia soli]MCF2527964.1 endo alpha-1,4 polygalactosaminidase [Yinghuangia soli]
MAETNTRTASPRIALAAALLLAFAAGCGGDGGKKAAPSASAPPGAAAASPAPEAPLSSPAPSDATSPSASSAAPGASGSPGAGKSPGSPPTSPAPAAPAGPATGGKPGAPPPANAGFDYQIGGPYALPPGVQVVVRDRGAAPQPGAYNVCYVNTFQAQPDAKAWWEKNHPDLLLRDGGAVVMDEDWGEALLDVSTEAKRYALIGVVGPWIDECARRGFQAVEPDNLDSFGRSHGKLTLAHNAAFATLLAARAHAAGLAIAQKNTVEMLDRRGAVGFDFAVSEECGQYDECGAFAGAYANRVFVVEYTKADFDKTCAGFGARLSVVLRDRGVTAPGQAGYVRASC